jgi:hypothetical protein
MLRRLAFRWFRWFRRRVIHRRLQEKFTVCVSWPSRSSVDPGIADLLGAAPLTLKSYQEESRNDKE